MACRRVGASVNGKNNESGTLSLLGVPPFEARYFFNLKLA
jgi:hypothetical protein